MNIEQFINKNIEKRDVYIKLLDVVNRVERTWQEQFTDFLTPDEQYFLNKVAEGREIVIKYFGGKESFERAVALISKVEMDIEFPVDIIKVKGNFKFEKLTHRDYLGTLLSLGIKREKIGDINVFDDGAEIYILRDFSDYVIYNISKIKHTGVKLEKITIDQARERLDTFEEKIVNVSSLRLDAIVSGAYNLSRAEGANLVKQGNVKLNYVLNDDQSFKVNEGDIVSIRGYGRFLFSKVLGYTKSQRLCVLIKKYK